MRMYLIGFMGSGKSTYGKQLASNIGYSFVDLDLLFEKEYHTTVFDFFENHSEEEFREKESLLLRQTHLLNNAIISLGGGTPCFQNNMDWILENGICVYLKLSPKALFHRLLNSKKKRPLLKNMSSEDLLRFIEDTLTEREIFYQCAHLTLSAIDLKKNKDNLVQLFLSKEETN